MSKGFGILEILIALVIMGLIMSIAIPNLKKLLPGQQKKEFVNQVNFFTQLAWQKAITTRQVFKIIFDINKRTISVTPEEGKPLQNTYIWPTNITIKNLYVNNEDLLHLQGRTTYNAWFFVVPDGLTQNVILNATLNEKELSLVLNPFTAQFTLYDKFQKP